MKNRDYNAQGLVSFCAAAGELVPMILAGERDKLQQAFVHLIAIARREFPGGPKQLKDNLNLLIAELDLPMIVQARSRDTNEIL